MKKIKTIDYKTFYIIISITLIILIAYLCVKIVITHYNYEKQIDAIDKEIENSAKQNSKSQPSFEEQIYFLIY